MKFAHKLTWRVLDASAVEEELSEKEAPTSLAKQESKSQEKE